MKLAQLILVVDPLPLTTLARAQVRELQIALGRLGYPVGEPDGLIGPKTRTAWAEFKTDVFEGNPSFIGPLSVGRLQEKLDELADVKAHDFTTKLGTIEAITWECTAQGIGLPAQIAYVLATVEWETAKTFRPVREAYWLSDAWRKRNLRYYPYYGRGYVQLTWRNNYRTYAQILGIDLVKEPDLALESSVALFILAHGFKTGTFTGRKITDYINEHRTDFVRARRCINGTDHDYDIAQLAHKHLSALAA